MKKITIAPIEVTEEQWKRGFSQPFRLSYRTESGENVFITDTMHARFGKLNDGEKVLTLNFDKNNRSRVLAFSNSSVGNQAYTTFMACPYLDHPENTSNKPRLFYVVDYEKSIVRGTEALKKKIMVLNKINNFSHREKSDVCFFMGENPVGKTDNELLIKLVDLEKGILLHGVQLSGEHNLDYFLRKFDGDTDAQVIIAIKKAIHFNIIEKKDAHYYIGNQLIGSSIDDLLSYCKNNDQMYNNFILKQVQSKDVLPNENYEPGHKQEESGDAEFAALKARAAELKIQGYAIMKDPVKLAKAIERKEKTLEYVQKNAEKRKRMMEEAEKED